jgi:hypothetical protein
MIARQQGVFMSCFSVYGCAVSFDLGIDQSGPLNPRGPASAMFFHGARRQERDGAPDFCHDFESALTAASSTYFGYELL